MRSCHLNTNTDKHEHRFYFTPCPKDYRYHANINCPHRYDGLGMKVPHGYNQLKPPAFHKYWTAIFIMLTLYTFGPAFGLPDASPFVAKALTLLKMSGLDFETDTKGFNKAPKGKLPYLKDGDQIIADSTFIRLHLEDKHGIDFDKGLDDSRRAVGWAFDKLCEDHLYWSVVHSRWMDDDNFNAGPKKFFDAAPRLIRPLITRTVRRKIAKNLHGHGFGRHNDEERQLLATRGVKAIADYLADKPYFLGDDVTGTDATIFAFVNCGLCTRFRAPMRTALEGHKNIKAYNERMKNRFFPEL